MLIKKSQTILKRFIGLKFRIWFTLRAQKMKPWHFLTLKTFFRSTAGQDFQNTKWPAVGKRKEEQGKRNEEGGKRKEEGIRRKEKRGTTKEKGGRRKEEGGRNKEEREKRNNERERRKEERGTRKQEGGRRKEEAEKYSKCHKTWFRFLSPV